MEHNRVKKQIGVAKSTKTGVLCGNLGCASKLECNRALAAHTFARTALKLAKQKEI